MTKTRASTKAMSERVAIVGGSRTPFAKSNGAYSELMAYELGRYAVNDLCDRLLNSPELIDFCVMGCVISDPRTSNLAREIVLSSKIPQRKPAFSVSMACISANVAISSAANMIRLGQGQIAVAGGAETFSDAPIRISKGLRQALAKSQKAKGIGDYWKLLSSLRPRDISLDYPSATEFSTGHTMGEGCERLAKRFGVTREESDLFAQRSHALALKAWKEGRYQNDVMTLNPKPSYVPVAQDDGPRESTLDQLVKLKPAFDPKFGIVTAASSSFFTDGASAVLLASERACGSESLTPIAFLVDEVFSASEPLDDLLIGPALTIPTLLSRNGLRADDIDVWEIHEAFAAQVLANLRKLESERIHIPMDKINTWGGSLSLGHPFGATGGRLVMTAARRLAEEKTQWAVVAGCAAGGQGSAMLIQRA